MRLLEDRAKAWLRARALPVPEGRAAATPDEAAAIARELGGRVAVKALVAAGRRGKAGGVRLAESGEAAAAAARAILGMAFAGQRTERVYVEAAVEISAELYLSFGFGRLAPQVVVSRQGGVDIEAVAAGDPWRAGDARISIPSAVSGSGRQRTSGTAPASRAGSFRRSPPSPRASTKRSRLPTHSCSRQTRSP